MYLSHPAPVGAGLQFSHAALGAVAQASRSRPRAGPCDARHRRVAAEHAGESLGLGDAARGLQAAQYLVTNCFCTRDRFQALGQTLDRIAAERI